MRGVSLLSLGCTVVLAACTGDPVGEAPSDGDVDSAVVGDTLDAETRGETLGETLGETADTRDDTRGDTDAATVPLAGKRCDKTLDCDPSGTTGAQCLTSAPTPICY